MDTTATTLTLVRLTAITVLTGLLVACSSALVRGSTVPDGWETGAGRMDGAAVRGTEIRAGDVPGTVIAPGVVHMGTDTSVTAMQAAATWATDSAARRQFAAVVDSTAHQRFAVADSMGMRSTAEEEGSTVVAVMEVGAANDFGLGKSVAGSGKLPAFSLFAQPRNRIPRSLGSAMTEREILARMTVAPSSRRSPQ